MDLSKLTHLELLELRTQINNEITDLENRGKCAVFAIFSYGDWDYYIHKENAKKALNELITEGEVIWCEEEFKTKLTFVDTAHMKYCKDYKEE